MSGSPLLEVEDLHVTFRTASGPVHAVDGVSFTMVPGASLGVVGESGSGKSVTARALLRLFAITDDVQISGSVRFDGQDLLRIDDRRLRHVRGGQIGMIFQDPLTSLNPLMAVGEQIAESLRLHRGMDRGEAASEAVDLVVRVGIADPEQRATELPSSFSGGMRQRVMISLAIACRPRLLIADEPTTALDVTVQAEILLLLDELRRSEGMALMLITHDFGVVAATCEDVQVMYAGKLVEKASMAHLFDRANHPYTEGLLRL
ncbi:MAG: ABC transporter ATP-binding protein, partial [Acidimicrobiaceae bacterium]|nr:ABC transporter ATP-binding protein [Acidimicrobiaceae bacterium]